MEQLLKRMAEDLGIRGYSPRTIKSYVQATRRFLEWSRKDLQALGMDDVRAYLVYLKQERRLSGSTINQALCGVRFLFLRVLRRSWDREGLRCHKRRRQLPVVLTRAEVQRLLGATSSLRQRALLTTIYSTGLRVSEAVSLAIRDIDSQAGRIHIRNGKGGQDRYALLSPRLVELLREYWRAYRPKVWLFPSQRPDRPIGTRIVQRACRRARDVAGLRKQVTPHTLRHSFATHLLESGVSLPYIQHLLGHRAIASTMIYLKISNEAATAIPSPLDLLPDSWT